MSRKTLSTEEFWIVGDFVARTFARWGGDHHGCYIDCSDPAGAEQFDTYWDALKHCCHEADMVKWRKSRRDPKAVKPLRCRVQVAVYPPGARP